MEGRYKRPLSFSQAHRLSGKLSVDMSLSSSPARNASIHAQWRVPSTTTQRLYAAHHVQYGVIGIGVLKPPSACESRNF